MLCSCVALAVGALAGWHFWLICNGETSIEVYINKKNRKKAKQEGKVWIVHFVVIYFDLKECLAIHQGCYFDALKNML